MKLLICFCMQLFFAKLAYSQHVDQHLFVQTDLKLISSQFKFTEGPAVDQEGNIYFTDQPNDQIWKYGIDEKLSLFLSPAGRANGTYVDLKGNLIACADEANQLWQISRNGKVKVLYENPVGKSLNGPNDLWIDKRGGIYFTDPYYQRDYWKRKSPDLDNENVYYLAKGAKSIKLVADDMMRPNGIVGSLDGKILYVGDAKAAKIYRFNIETDGTLTNRQLIINQRTDGMTLDNQGNIYLTGKGVSIFNPKGEQIAQIDIPENHTANVCFGGRERNLLFITASKSFYVLPMSVKGIE